ncbi:hypothetical protein [uncultured Thalassolituus sp.]|uniref:hypothetical protein n=1 Tax=uncultured Thalassolituus sp. TaxID=285273 RepID=UPI00260BCCBF|nr:hypothetical protein [uncultured Thalassolituus sp.]
MNFEFDTSENLKIVDSELTEILKEVYVDGGFTDSELAEEIFEATAVRDRGAIFGIRNRESFELASIAIWARLVQRQVDSQKTERSRCSCLV